MSIATHGTGKHLQVVIYVSGHKLIVDLFFNQEKAIKVCSALVCGKIISLIEFPLKDPQKFSLLCHEQSALSCLPDGGKSRTSREKQLSSILNSTLLLSSYLLISFLFAFGTFLNPSRENCGIMRAVYHLLSAFPSLLVADIAALKQTDIWGWGGWWWEVGKHGMERNSIWGMRGMDKKKAKLMTFSLHRFPTGVAVTDPWSSCLFSVFLKCMSS